VRDEQTKQMVESNEMIDMRVRDEDLIDASDPPRRQQRNFSKIEQQAALFEQRLHIHRRIAVATIDQARMEKRSHGKPFCCSKFSRAAWAVLCLHRASITPLFTRLTSVMPDEVPTERQFRAALPATEKTCPRVCNGRTRRPERRVLSCFATIPMHPPAPGTIGRLAIFRPP